MGCRVKPDPPLRNNERGYGVVVSRVAFSSFYVGVFAPAIRPS